MTRKSTTLKGLNNKYLLTKSVNQNQDDTNIKARDFNRGTERLRDGGTEGWINRPDRLP